MAMADEDIIFARTEGLRSFAGAGPEININALDGTLAPPSYAPFPFPGCSELVNAHVAARAVLPTALTRAQQHVWGIRERVGQVAALHEETEGRVLENFNAKVPVEANLPTLAPELDLQMRLEARA